MRTTHDTSARSNTSPPSGAFATCVEPDSRCTSARVMLALDLKESSITQQPLQAGVADALAEETIPGRRHVDNPQVVQRNSFFFILLLQAFFLLALAPWS